MTAPYIELLYDHLARTIVESTIAYAHGTLPLPQPYQWQVTSDASSKVTIRALDARNQLTVIGTGRWYGAATAEHVRSASAPLDEGAWKALDAQLAPLLLRAMSRGAPDPAALDSGTVADPTTAPLPTSGSPFVQFYAYKENGKRAWTNVVEYAPKLRPDDSAYTVTCDSRGRVVVRSRTGHTIMVCATATYRDGQLVDHAQMAATPTAAHWAEIGKTLRELLQNAGYAQTLDRTTVDDAGLGTTSDVPLTPDEVKKKADRKYTIAAGVLIGAGVVAMAIFGVPSWLDKEKGHNKRPSWDQTNKPRTSRANGDSCEYDDDCASNNCYRRTCRAWRNHDVRKGDPCVDDSECESGNCSSVGRSFDDKICR